MSVPPVDRHFESTGDRRLFPPAYQRAMTLTDRLAGGIVVNSDYIRGILARNFDVPDERMLHVQERRRR